MKTILTLSLILLLSLASSAQPHGPRFPAPFGFIEILIGAGAILGGKKLYEIRKEKEEE